MEDLFSGTQKEISLEVGDRLRKVEGGWSRVRTKRGNRGQDQKP